MTGSAGAVLSAWEDKIEQAPPSPFGSARARRWLKKHTTWSDGSPMYTAIKRDASGLWSFSLTRLTTTYWRRVLCEGGDMLFEQCTQAEAEGL